MVMTAYITTHFIIQHPLNKAERQANGQRAALSAFYSHISQTRKHPRLYLEASDLSNQTWFPAFVTPQLVTRNQWNAIDTTDPYLLQLRRAPNIAAKCFIQTDQGCTFATCELDYCWQVLSYATSWWRPQHIFFPTSTEFVTHGRKPILKLSLYIFGSPTQIQLRTKSKSVLTKRAVLRM